MKTGLEDNAEAFSQVRDKPPLPPLSPGCARKTVRSPTNFYDTNAGMNQVHSSGGSSGGPAGCSSGGPAGVPQRPYAPTPEQEVARILSFDAPPKRNSVANLSQDFVDDQLRFRPISPPSFDGHERPMSPPPLPLTPPPLCASENEFDDDLIIRFSPSFNCEAMDTESSSQSRDSLEGFTSSSNAPKRGDHQRPASLPPSEIAQFSTFLGPFGPPQASTTNLCDIEEDRIANITFPPQQQQTRAKPNRPLSPTLIPFTSSSSRPTSPITLRRSCSPSKPFASIGPRSFSPKLTTAANNTEKSRFVNYTNFKNGDDQFKDFFQMKRKVARLSSSVLVEPKWQVPEWSVDEVVMWVNKAGFKEYSAAFADSAVDGDILLSLTDSDIREDIGIKNGIQRKRFMRELKNLKKNADYGCADDHGATANFLAKISPEFRAYTYNLVNNDLSYEYLLRLDPSSLDDMLKYVGIESAIHRHKIVEAVMTASSDDDETMLDRLYLEANTEPSDIYISYPRTGGAELASLISMQMQLRGFSVISAPNDGSSVSEAVKNQVRDSKFFVLIMPLGALDECLNQEKCRLYWELYTALQHGINIIPVSLDFQWPEPTELPDEIRGVCYYNSVRWVHDYQTACIDKLEKFTRQDPNLLRTNTDSPVQILTRSGRSTPQIQLATSPRMKPRHRTPSVDSAIGFSPAPSTSYLSQN